MTDKPYPWVKENIRLFASEAADREFALVESEAASDSDLLRQSLRNTAQLVDDVDLGRTLWVRDLNGNEMQLTPELFRDPPDYNGLVLRRSLILHQSSKDRIELLKLRLGLDDISAVARFSLRFFCRIIKDATSGARFFVHDENGNITEVRFGVFTRSASFSEDKLPKASLEDDKSFVAPPIKPTRPKVGNATETPRSIFKHGMFRIK